MALLLLLTGCRTVKQESANDHYMSERLESIDSLLRQHTVIQQDSAWHELILRQFQSIRERSDTSHTIIVDTAGKVIKERIVIREQRETQSDTQSHEREVLMHRLDQMDSTISRQSLTISHLDSLLQQQHTTTEVPAKLTWWQQTRIRLANILLYGLIIIAAFWFIYTKMKK